MQILVFCLAGSCCLQNLDFGLLNFVIIYNCQILGANTRHLAGGKYHSCLQNLEFLFCRKLVCLYIVCQIQSCICSILQILLMVNSSTTASQFFLYFLPFCLQKPEFFLSRNLVQMYTVCKIGSFDSYVFRYIYNSSF